jgi:F0F1-type ATP synthase membrane subunit b/b'
VNIKSFSVIPLISSSPASNDVNLDTLRKELAEIVRLQEDLQQRRADVEAKIAKLDNESRSIVAESKLTTMGDKGNNLKTTPVSGHMRVAAGDSSCESSGSAVMEKLASRLGDLDIVPPDDP